MTRVNPECETEAENSHPRNLPPAIRKFLQTTSRRITATAAGVGAVLIMGLLFLYMRHAMRINSLGPSPKCFFTDDDGATWFIDDAGRQSPFDHDGKQAVRVYLWTCDGGKTIWPGYLERTNRDAQKDLSQFMGHLLAQHPPSKEDSIALQKKMQAVVEVKEPRNPAAAWVNANDADFAKVTSLHCPETCSDPAKATPFLADGR